MATQRTRKSMVIWRRMSVVLLVGAAMMSLVVGVFVSPPGMRRTAHAAAAVVREYNSLWASYIAIGSGYEWASAEWNVPQITSATPCSNGDGTYRGEVDCAVSMWVGLGGAIDPANGNNPGNLIQAGTDSYVDLNGTPVYHTWWEDRGYKHAYSFVDGYRCSNGTGHASDTFAISPDDHIRVYVSSNYGSESSGSVYFRFENLTTGCSYWFGRGDPGTGSPLPPSQPSATASTAEWVAEIPGGLSYKLGKANPDVDEARFSAAKAGQSGTALFLGQTTYNYSVVTDGSGDPNGTILAEPGKVSCDGTSFKVYFKRSPETGCGGPGGGGGGGSSAMPPPSIVRTSANQPDVFYQTGGRAYQRVRNSDGSWAGPWPVGTTNASIAGAAQAFNLNLVYARSSDNWIRQTYWTGSAWSDWQTLPGAPSGGFVGDPYLLHNGGSGGDPNYPEIFATAGNGNVYHTFVVNGAWVGWLQVSAGAPVVGNAVPWNSGRIYARTSDGQISQTYWTPSGYSAWGALPGTPGGGFIGDPVLAPPGSGGDPNYPEIFATGANGHVYHTYVLNGAWIGWYQIADNTALKATPAVLNSANLYANSGDCIRDAYWVPNAYSGWWCLPAGATPGGGFAGPPVLTSSSSGMDAGYPDVYATTADAHLYHTYVINGLWVPWSQVA